MFYPLKLSHRGEVRDFVPGNVGKALAKKVGSNKLKQTRKG